MLPMPDPATFLQSLEDLYRRSSKPPRMILISFPHNPTTQCVDLDFFKEIIRLARHHGTMVVHDFAYADLGFDGYRPPSILQVEGAKEVAVEIFSLSKSYNMAGWRVGFCLGNPRMIGALARIKSYLDYGVFQPIQIASIIALRECEEDTKKICAVYQKRRDILIDGLRRAGWPVEPPKGAMFVWAPLPEQYKQLGSLEFSKKLSRRSAGRRFARHRFRTHGRRLRALRADRKRPTHPPSHHGDQKNDAIEAVALIMAAALADPAPSQTLDLRSVDVETLAPILAEQIASWKAELDWDFTPSANLVRRFVQMHVLTGYVLISRADPSPRHRLFLLRMRRRQRPHRRPLYSEAIPHLGN